MTHTRIAPTPSGFLHQGNACNFLLTAELVRKAKGSLRLRIDDLDTGRVRAEFLNDVFESLAWLGIIPDEGPQSVPEHETQYSQLLRIDEYAAMLQRLVASGRVFACECSRAEVARNALGGRYAGTCRAKKLSLDTPGLAWRFRTDPQDIAEWQDGLAGMQRIDVSDRIRDFVIRRRDGVAAYQVASLSDDLKYSINLIVRGADLLDSTAAQLLLARTLGEDAFLKTQFYHHPLMLDEYGEKLSKSAGSDSLKSMRAAGKDGIGFRNELEAWIDRLGVV